MNWQRVEDRQGLASQAEPAAQRELSAGRWCPSSPFPKFESYQAGWSSL
jgi:hypothetical protein